MFTNYKYEKILVLIFICTLPLVNPWVRGDGVGYYAFARALLIQHHLDFRQDWLRANSSFRLGRVDDQNRLLPEEFTSNGHLDNHFSIGPAMLWSPFLLAAHGAVKINHLFGGHIPADGFSLPYIFAIVIATAIYGFLGILFSFELAKKYLPARWAFLGCLGIWFASSLPVYMYFNPSWSHAQSAFAVALFFWYWDRTRADRSWTQWLVLGVISGLMMDVYYVCAVLLLVPLIESLVRYWQDIRSRQMSSVWRLFLQNVLFTLAAFLVFLPTLIVKKIIYGSYLEFGYGPHWAFHVACLAESVFFVRARPFQLDADNSACGDWLVSSEKSRSRAELVLPAGVRVLSIRHRMLRGLGGHFFVRQSIFCFADSAIHFGPGRVLRLARRSVARAARGDIVRGPHYSLDHLESGADLSVGHASDPGARADFLA